MANRHTSITLLLFLAAAGCGADSPDSSKLNGNETAVDIPEDQLIRTANPYARGYTDSDFPRIQELAPGVYSYEQLRSAGGRSSCCSLDNCCHASSARSLKER